MVGMIQILTWLVAAHLIVKGLIMVQITYASTRCEELIGFRLWSLFVLCCCIAFAIFCVTQQDQMAVNISDRLRTP